MASQRRRNKNSHSGHQERQFTVRGIHRDPVDIRKLSKALIGLAMAEAEHQAQAEHTARHAQSGLSAEGDAQPGGQRDA